LFVRTARPGNTTRGKTVPPIVGIRVGDDIEDSAVYSTADSFIAEILAELNATHQRQLDSN